MMVTTIENMPGREIKEILGVVFGSCVQTKHIGKDIRAGLRTVVGGEVHPVCFSCSKNYFVFCN